MTRFQGGDLRRQKATWIPKWPERLGPCTLHVTRKGSPLHSLLIKSPKTPALSLDPTACWNCHPRSRPVSPETERSTPQISGFQRGSRVYNSVSSEILSMARNKRTQMLIMISPLSLLPDPRNITSPNNHKRNLTSVLCTDSQAGIPPILIPKQTPLFAHPIAKPVPSPSSPSQGSQTKAGHAGKLFRDYTPSPLISRGEDGGSHPGPYRKWKTRTPTSGSTCHVPAFPTLWFLGSSNKIFHHAASQTNIWGVMDHFHSC